MVRPINDFRNQQLFALEMECLARKNGHRHPMADQGGDSRNATVVVSREELREMIGKVDRLQEQIDAMRREAGVKAAPSRHASEKRLGVFATALSDAAKDRPPSSHEALDAAFDSGMSKRPSRPQKPPPPKPTKQWDLGPPIKPHPFGVVPFWVAVAAGASTVATVLGAALYLFG